MYLKQSHLAIFLKDIPEMIIQNITENKEYLNITSDLFLHHVPSLQSKYLLCNCTIPAPLSDGYLQVCGKDSRREFQAFFRCFQDIPGIFHLLSCSSGFLNFL